LKKYWDEALNGELKDQSGNPIGVPIKDAMQQIISGQGLPTRAQTDPNKVEDGKISSPTAESSGRQSQKRLQ
jgi:hypothetical protein